MDLKRCEKGHYWNPEEYDSCPTCSGVYGATVPLKAEPLEKTASEKVGATMPLSSAVGATMPLPSAIGATIPVVPNVGDPQDEGHTIPAYLIDSESGKVDPVVGWLVCVEGAEKGKDYRLHGSYNQIGRDPRLDVCIRGDMKISREASAWIAYDERSRQFLFGAGDSTNFVYLNDQPIPRGQSTLIKSMDQILIGDSKLMFMPLCSDTFAWEQK